jgi:hypothetical protein
MSTIAANASGNTPPARRRSASTCPDRPGRRPGSRVLAFDPAPGVGSARSRRRPAALAGSLGQTAPAPGRRRPRRGRAPGDNRAARPGPTGRLRTGCHRPSYLPVRRSPRIAGRGSRNDLCIRYRPVASRALFCPPRVTDHAAVRFQRPPQVAARRVPQTDRISNERPTTKDEGVQATYVVRLA